MSPRYFFTTSILLSIEVRRRWGISLFNYFHYLDHPSAFEDAEKFLAETIAALALLEKPVQVADFYMRHKAVYLLPNYRLPFCADSLQIDLVHKALDELLALARYFELFRTLQLF